MNMKCEFAVNGELDIAKFTMEGNNADGSRMK